MKLYIDDQEFEVDPISLRVQDSDVVFVDQAAVRESFTRQVLMDVFLSRAWHTEPFPCGISQILNAARQVEDVALLACHYDLYPQVRDTHKKLCSHLTECIPDSAAEKDMVCEAARYLCRIETVLDDFNRMERQI